MKRAMPSRVVFVILSVITIALLFGSMILQNIYFKADQVDSSLFIAPTTFSRKPNSTVTLKIQANIQGRAVVAGSQFFLEYDQKLLEFVEAVPAPPFVSLQLASDDGAVVWSLLPTPEQGTTLQIGGEVTFGAITFKTLSEGQATVRFRQGDSKITAVDSSQSPALYNAITSTQDSSGVISEINGESPKPSEVLSKSTELLPVFSAQKVLRNDPIVAANSAKLLVSLKYVGGVSVRFGTTSDMPLTIESNELNQHHLVDFSALEPETRYYYQLYVYSEDKKTSLKSQVRSFVTTSANGGKAELKSTTSAVLPETAARSTKIVVAARDNQGNSSGDRLSFVSVSGSVELSEQQTSNGITVVKVTSNTTTSQTAVISVRSGDSEIAQAKVAFDPTIAQNSEPTYKFSGPISVTPNNALFMFLAAAGMVLFGLLFIRLAKSK